MYLSNNILKKYSHKKKIIVSSFESVVLEKIHYIYAIGTYSNQKSLKLWILSKYIKLNSLLLIHTFIQDLLIQYKQSYLIYVYSSNFQKFDSYFLLKTLTIFQQYDPNYIKAKIIIRHGLIYKIQINNIVFVDSFTLLNKSLKKISKKSKEKEIYNKKNRKYSLDRLKQFIKTDLKNTSNVISLTKWQLFIKYKIQLTKSISLSTMSLDIFKKNFKNSSKLFNNDILSYNLLCGSYLGGISNIYLPCSKNETVYGYDLNSLYPYIMYSRPLPLGKPLVRLNKLHIDFNNFFGFIEATLLLNTNSDIPLLSIQKKTNIQQSVGYISGVWFSEELKMILHSKEVISFKIHKTIKYNKEILLKEFTKHFYLNRLKSSYKKTDNVNKFFMNHLSGRFGLKLTDNLTKFVSNKDFIQKKYLQNSKISSNILNDNFNLINIVQKKTIKLQNKHSNLQSPLHISSAINAYSRCYLMKLIQFKKNNGYKTIFTDTDSIYSTTKMVKSKNNLKHLGFLKFELLSKRLIFLNRNIYYFKNMFLNSSSKKKSKFFNILNLNKFRFKTFIKNLKNDNLMTSTNKKRKLQSKKQIWKANKTFRIQ